MSVRDEQVRDDHTSWEVDQHTDDQPPRGDVVDPQHLRDAGDGTEPLEEDLNLVDDPDPFHRDGDPPRASRSTEDLPESQGYDADVADRLGEDDGTRVPLDDEEWREP